MKNFLFSLFAAALIFPTSVLAAPLKNPLEPISDIRVLIGTIIKAFLGISGSIALIMFVWGGFLWMTSQGNNEKVKKGQQTLVWAVGGLLIIFSAYTIVNAVINALSTGQTAGAP
ncbi:MAG: hypothetical protein ACD_76C00066G0002 [uncultured bacterium]|nr:MAG: hypothetical protein ACD_76C00066G0002 [uncultured bacterium]HBD05736.1 hypothetical protein [Candidatus Uhrbacteria bacterium]